MQKQLTNSLVALFLVVLLGLAFTVHQADALDSKSPKETQSMAKASVSREKVYKEIEETFGLVPSFFKAIPDSSLELEWELFKRVQLETGPIPNKYRDLIGVAISAVTKCRYCIFYHTEVAKLYGATDAEIEDAVHFAKSSAGWSTYINGMQIDYDQFKKEVLQACAYIRSKSNQANQK
jgi:AhpD family alkylhydroperoxidase